MSSKPGAVSFLHNDTAERSSSLVKIQFRGSASSITSPIGNSNGSMWGLISSSCSSTKVSEEGWLQTLVVRDR